MQLFFSLLKTFFCYKPFFILVGGSQVSWWQLNVLGKWADPF